MSWLEISPSNAAQTASDSPFTVDNSLTVGGSGEWGGYSGGITGLTNTGQAPTNTAANPRGNMDGNAIGPGASTVPPSTASSSSSSLLSSSTLWLAIGAIASIYVAWKLYKKSS